jgi:hypothetical protein
LQGLSVNVVLGGVEMKGARYREQGRSWRTQEHAGLHKQHELVLGAMASMGRGSARGKRRGAVARTESLTEEHEEEEPGVGDGTPGVVDGACRIGRRPL